MNTKPETLLQMQKELEQRVKWLETQHNVLFGQMLQVQPIQTEILWNLLRLHQLTGHDYREIGARYDFSVRHWENPFEDIKKTCEEHEQDKAKESPAKDSP